jgi:hypothetical protein
MAVKTGQHILSSQLVERQVIAIFLKNAWIFGSSIDH